MLALEAWGIFAAAQGQAQRAARLLGSAEALRETIGAPLPVSDRAHYDYDRYAASIRVALGEERMAAAWAEGRAMTLEQAIACALED